jgi:hypothetical protein
VELDLQDNFGCEYHPGQESFEILRYLSWVDSFDLSIGHFSDRTYGINIALSTYDGHYVHCDTLRLGVFTTLRVELRAFFLALSMLDTTETFVRGSISAHDDLRAQAPLSGKSDGCEHAGSESGTSLNLQASHFLQKVLIGLLNRLGELGGCSSDSIF